MSARAIRFRGPSGNGKHYYVCTCNYLPGTNLADRMISMRRQITKLTTGQDRGRLSPCVCNTLRMVTRVVTQLYDDCLRPSGLRVTQFSILAAVARLGEASLKQLEDELAIDQTTLTRGLCQTSCETPPSAIV